MDSTAQELQDQIDGLLHLHAKLQQGYIALSARCDALEELMAPVVPDEVPEEWAE